jgi:hypothetical protein
VSRFPFPGSVVWAELEDANGFRKLRPAVVISAATDIAAGNPAVLVAITTQLPDPLPDTHVLLPWDPKGRARSGLRRKCAAVATWTEKRPISDIQQIVGFIPTILLQELMNKVVFYSSSAPGGGISPNPPLPP